MLTQTTTIEPDDDDPYIALDMAGRYVPGRPHRATLWRWALTGVNRRGQIIRLRTIVVGGRRYVTRDWLDDFIAGCAAGDPSAVPAPAMTPARRRSQAQAAMAALATR